MTTTERMNKHEVARVKAAVHRLLVAAPTLSRTTRAYREEWESVVSRVAAVENSGGKKRRHKAQAWLDALDAVKPHG